MERSCSYRELRLLLLYEDFGVGSLILCCDTAGFSFVCLVLLVVKIPAETICRIAATIAERTLKL